MSVTAGSSLRSRITETIWKHVYLWQNLVLKGGFGMCTTQQQQNVLFVNVFLFIPEIKSLKFHFINSRRIKWVGPVPRKRELRTAYSQFRRKTLRDLEVDGRIIINGCYRNWLWGCEPDLCGSGNGSVAGSCEHGNEFSSSKKKKDKDIFDQLSHC
jgi:hypothetical protein